ncbi:MAG: glycosyl transferase family 1 [Acidobacteria bacterium]|nr:MAG: glycosyl transferase family 1 [Acidobacteriota bacterium]
MVDTLKFCMVTTFYPPYNFGGDGIYIYRLSNELARRGHQVDVIHCRDAFLVLSSSVKGDYPNHPNVKVHGLKSSAGFLSPFLTQQTGRPFLKSPLRKILAENQFDIIHFHNMSLMGITTLQYGNAIKLYTMHEHWLVCPMHVLWKFNREICTERSCIQCQIRGKRPPQLWRYTNLLHDYLAKVDAFISPSRFTLNKHHQLGFQYPIRHIPYFLPRTEEASEDASSQPQDRRFFLFVGRLEKIKGIQNLIPVFRNHPEYELLIAGDGEYGDELRKLSADVPNMRFLGRLNYNELRKLYREALAVIVPSICYEVFGIIIIEAFSMKTPVIVHNLGGLSEVVEDSGGGFTYNNEAELLRAMKTLSSDWNIRTQLGEMGYAAYLKYWTEENHFKLYFDLIESLQKRRKSVQEANA